MIESGHLLAAGLGVAFPIIAIGRLIWTLSQKLTSLTSKVEHLAALRDEMRDVQRWRGHHEREDNEGHEKILRQIADLKVDVCSRLAAIEGRLGERGE